MHILVVGGAGYIGSALVPELQRRNHKVRVIDLLWFGNSLPNNVDLIQKDFFDLNEGDLQGFDTVIFLAGLSNDPMAEFSPRENFISNAAGPAYLAYIAKKARVRRFIHGGSCSVYGNMPGIFVSESSATHSDYPYGISKLIGENSVLGLVSGTFSVIALRKGTVCGYSPRMRFDLIVNAMTRDAVTKGRIRVNNPNIYRPILSIRDAVQAYVKAVTAGPYINGVFNIRSFNSSVGVIAKKVVETVNKKLKTNVTLETLFVPDKRDYRALGVKATEILDFIPTSSVESIVEDILDKWNQDWDAYNKKYYNVDTFMGLTNLELERKLSRYSPETTRTATDLKLSELA